MINGIQYIQSEARKLSMSEFLNRDFVRRTMYGSDFFSTNNRFCGSIHINNARDFCFDVCRYSSLDFDSIFVSEFPFQELRFQDGYLCFKYKDTIICSISQIRSSEFFHEFLRRLFLIDDSQICNISDIASTLVANMLRRTAF